MVFPSELVSFVHRTDGLESAVRSHNFTIRQLFDMSDEGWQILEVFQKPADKSNFTVYFRIGDVVEIGNDRVGTASFVIDGDILNVRREMFAQMLLATSIIHQSALALNHAGQQNDPFLPDWIEILDVFPFRRFSGFDGAVEKCCK